MTRFDRRPSALRPRRPLFRAPIALAAVAIVVAPFAAYAAGKTADNRGPEVFTFAKETGGQDTAPGVDALADGSARVAWVSYDKSSHGDLMTCLIVRGQGKCSDTANLGKVATAGNPEPNSGTRPIVLSGANGELVILAGEIGTYAYISSNNGKTFDPPVAISTTVDSQAAQLTANGSNVILAGSGNDAVAGDLHFIEVSLTGDDADASPVIEHSVQGSIDDSFGIYRGTSVLATTPINTDKVDVFHLTGNDANEASSWTRSTLSHASLPSLATTSQGLVLGAEYTSGTASYPEAFVFNGHTFGHPAKLQKSFGNLAIVAASGSTSPEGHSRWTVTWNVVDGEANSYAEYAASSGDGRHWVTTRIASQKGAVIQSSEASISPDGGGLVVQDFAPALRAIRLYVGTALSVKPHSATVGKGGSIALTGKLKTDLGFPVPGASIVVRAGRHSETTKTARDGSFRAKVRLMQSGDVSISYRGSDLFDPSATSVKGTVS